MAGDSQVSVTSDKGLKQHPQLRREIGLGNAVMMGLGSMIGTGVFVSIGIAAETAGVLVIPAILLAACIAACNALNSAQLAAQLPVSGGTYEYGYHYLHSSFGFTAGWMFLCAKSASAATASLGFAGYLSSMARITDQRTQLVISLLAIAVLTIVVLQGGRPASWVNLGIVTVTLSALLFFVLCGLPLVFKSGAKHLLADLPQNKSSVLEATALMFVAFTGFGRIATLGEEVRTPRTTIPKAIILTVIASALIYIAVGVVGIGVVGDEAMAQATRTTSAPLEVIASGFSIPGASYIVAAGAMTAMLGVLLNLLLGLSRVLLAMGRRGDMPARIATLNAARTTPYVAVMTIVAFISTLTLVGNVKTTWSFSAFTVLIYYSVTNLAALMIPSQHRLYPQWLAWVGMFGCLFLAFWLKWQVWTAGLAIIGIGLAWHGIAQRTVSKDAMFR